MAILVTGGAGYIGAHTCVQLLDQGHDLIIVDNLVNSNEKALDRVREITGKDFPFYRVDLLDKEALDGIFQEHDIEGVIHFAGLKAVGESVSIPLHYYHNNITGTLNLCDVMKTHNVKQLVFSSSATVYGDPDEVPIQETASLRATNPYGRTKLMIEEILQDLHVADEEWSISILRYFNPIGAHPSGRIGENPNGIPNNLFPYITQVAVGKLEQLQVFGDDYPTPDGTGVRDYIHVDDLANGHLKAYEKINNSKGVHIHNLGTGNGYSVLEVIQAFEKETGQKVPYKVIDRRPGDIAECYADPEKAKEELGWEAKKGLQEMCRDSWNWQYNNPNGYE
ncbi:UDP-glucose 4-epimerase GalE [Halobacillus fulvus]|nr:UDP-glucose 4-epimerase GalE [Halobacillus fulvus]